VSSEKISARHDNSSLNKKNPCFLSATQFFTRVHGADASILHSQHFFSICRTFPTQIRDLDEWCAALNPVTVRAYTFSGGNMSEQQYAVEDGWQAPPAQTEELPVGLIGDEI
jgi:hypothetical protein